MVLTLPCGPGVKVLTAMGLFSFRKPKVVARVAEDKIIVTMPDTNFTVTYERAKGRPGLVATSFGGRKDQASRVSLPTFLADAWKTANEKARDLGWIP